MTDLTLLILLCIAPFCLDNKTALRRNVGAWLIFICLVFLFGFRHYSVGTDSANYAFRYEKLMGLEPFEIGFIWLMKGLHVVCADYTFLFVVLAVIIWGGLVKFYNKYTKLYWVSIFLFCALGGINTVANNGVRQGIAIVLFLTAIPYALQKQWIQYYILGILAFLFHRSSIFIFPLYFLIQIKFKWYLLALLIFMFCGVLAFADQITNFLFSDYDRYLVGIEQIGKGKLIQLSLISCFALFPSYYHYQTLEKNLPFKNMLLWMTALYILCAWGVYISNVGDALNRLAWYLFPIVFLNFSVYIEEKSPKLKWLLFLNVINLIFCYRLGVYHLSDKLNQADMIYYYKFFWQ